MKGELVEVCAGRKIRVGTVGRCIWEGRTRFGDRVLVSFDDGSATSEVFMSRENVRLVEDQPIQQALFGATREEVGDVPF